MKKIKTLFERIIINHKIVDIPLDGGWRTDLITLWKDTKLSGKV